MLPSQTEAAAASEAAATTNAVFITASGHVCGPRFPRTPPTADLGGVRKKRYPPKRLLGGVRLGGGYVCGNFYDDFCRRERNGKIHDSTNMIDANM